MEPDGQEAIDQFSLSPMYADAQFMNEKKCCKVCNRPYITLESIGKLQCRYHPDTFPYSDDYTVARYSCCGQPLNPRDPGYRRELRYGCTPADHTILDRPYIKQDGLQTAEYPQSLPPQSVITYDSYDCRYTIWRYDFIQAEYRLRYCNYSAAIDARLKAEMIEELCLHAETDTDTEFTESESEDEDEGDGVIRVPLLGSSDSEEEDDDDDEDEEQEVIMI